MVGMNVVFCVVVLCYNGFKNGKKKKDVLNVLFKVNIFY